MCGIAGIACTDPNRGTDESRLRRMTQIMWHRGPDSEGFHRGPGIGLGMRRLSIIDTATGDQPIANEDGSVVVVCNGEIYNFVELRARLQAAGHRFRTQSDTEVIVHLYEEDPSAFVEQLRGMFALAVWDSRRRRLTLARDRFGIKPLHYALTNEGVIFGSELKAILAAGGVSACMDRDALRDVFTFGYVRTPRSMVVGVNRLRAGECLTFESGTVKTRQYWDLTFPAAADYDRSRSDDAWADQLRAELTNSVRLHLRSDVPVGVWLSAGIDSSAVAAVMQTELRRPLPTFTLGFENPQVDELRYHRLLDEYPSYQLVGHRLECRREHCGLLPRAVWHREQPFGQGVDISRMLIAEASAREVKVVLCGEGADEALGGYAWYRADKALAPAARWPLALRRLAAAGVRRRWPGASTILLAPAAMGVSRFRALSGGATNADLPDGLLLGGTVGGMESSPLPAEFAGWHRFAQLQYLDFKLRLAESVVQHLDSHSMAYSLEARVPFLDHPLVEFCATIPPWVKLRGLQEKAVLRRAMRGVLPPSICRRRKRPLSAPVRDWMRPPLPDVVRDSLSASRIRDTGFFDASCVAGLLRAHEAGVADHSRLLLLIAGTQLWDEMFRKRLACVTV